jgi:thiol:disulfide interchange protein DsbC
MKIHTTWALALVLGAATASAATDPQAEQAVRDAVHKLAPTLKIDSVQPAPLAGLYTVVAGGQVVYVSADGKYMLQGSLYDIANRVDLTSARMDGIRKAALASVPAAKHIEFAPDNPKYHVTVFTDLDCGYCRKLHSHIADFNKAGIAVDYLFFPRTGLGTPSYDKAVSVWCAANRKQAFTLAKQGADPTPAKCDNPVAEEYTLGEKLGVDGTPTVIASDGSVIGGYLTPEQMLQRLQAVDAKAAKGG